MLTPQGINDLGHIAGVVDGTNCNQQAWIWTPEAGPVSLGAVPGPASWSWALAINNHDAVVGRSQSSLGTQAFLWTAETGMIGLGDLAGPPYYSSGYDINDSGWIVGRANSTCGSFLWTPQAGMVSLCDLFPEDFREGLQAVGINNSGQIVGTVAAPDLLPCPFFWDSQTGLTCMRPILAAMNYCSPGYLNERGEVIGWCYRYDGGAGAPFVWDARRGMRNLDQIIDPCARRTTSFRHVEGPFGINDSGQIIAAANNNNTTYGFPDVLLTPYLPGDLNDDGTVNVNDLTILLSHFGTMAGAMYADGDVERCDGDVDLRDLTTLLSNFGETYP